MNKKIFFLSFSTLLINTLSKSQAVTDTVTLGAGYANEIWYSLQNDNQGSSPKNNWDIAFEASNQGSAIRINAATGTRLWLHPTADTSDFAALDTAGIASWTTEQFNSEITWSVGAFDASADVSDPYDVGWGTYNMITHTVIGDRLFVIKLSNNTYQKIWIQLLASGTYTFRMAALDNSFDMVHTLVKADYAGKNFGYFNLQTHADLDREPASATWDLAFTQYTTFIPQAYLVTGVLQNKTTEVVMAYPLNNPTTFEDWGGYTFSSDINIPGYNWKTFNMSTFVYDIADSTVYFVKDNGGNVWKMIFTGFSGSSAGRFIFTKEMLSATSVAEVSTPELLGVYPNPATDYVTVVFDAKQSADAVVELIDLSGKLMQTYSASGGGMIVRSINVSDVPAGMYLVRVVTENGSSVKKITVN